MYFFTGFLFYLCQFIFLAAVAFGGILAGIQIRKRKNAKQN